MHVLYWRPSVKKLCLLPSDILTSPFRWPGWMDAGVPIAKRTSKGTTAGPKVGCGNGPAAYKIPILGPILPDPAQQYAHQPRSHIMQNQVPHLAPLLGRHGIYHFQRQLWLSRPCHPPGVRSIQRHGLLLPPASFSPPLLPNPWVNHWTFPYQMHSTC